MLVFSRLQVDDGSLRSPQASIDEAKRMKDEVPMLACLFYLGLDRRDPWDPHAVDIKKEVSSLATTYLSWEEIS